MSPISRQHLDLILKSYYLANSLHLRLSLLPTLALITYHSIIWWLQLVSFLMLWVFYFIQTGIVLFKYYRYKIYITDQTTRFPWKLWSRHPLLDKPDTIKHTCQCKDWWRTKLSRGENRTILSCIMWPSNILLKDGMQMIPVKSRIIDCSSDAACPLLFTTRWYPQLSAEWLPVTVFNLAGNELT